MNIKQKHRALKLSRKGAGIIPVKAHLTEHVALTNKDALVAVIRCDGINYEDKTMAQLERYKSMLNNAYLNVQDPRLGMWNCMLRRFVGVEVNKDLACEFSKRFAERYEENLKGKTMQNYHYIAFVYNPMPIGSSIQKLRDKSLYKESLEAGIEFLEDKIGSFLETIKAYKPVRLGIDNNDRSEIGAFYTNLFYFKPHTVPVSKSNMAESVFNRRVLFGNELVEIRHHSESTYAAVLGIKEYPDSTSPDMYIQLNSLSFEFNFVQSFLFIAKAEAKRQMIEQRNILVSSGDVAISQVGQIDEALDDLISGRFSLGSHSASLIVHTPNQKDIKDIINTAHSALQDANLVVVREDMANEGHYLSQLPGNHLYRPRPAKISTVNFASMAPMFGTPTGTATGNHWGKAVLPFMTLTGQPYYFSNHVEDTGSLGIYGMTGAGKTVLMNSLEVMLRRGNIRHVHFDKDEGSMVAIYALGGTYHSFKTGEPTGINPFWLEPTPKNIYYIIDLIELLVGDVTSEQKELIETAVNAVFALEDKKLRRFGALRNYLDPTEENGVAARLVEWMGDARHGWVFDNEENTVEISDIMGFDFTEFLDNDRVRTPIMSYLLHRVMEMIDGTPICIWMDEFWKLLDDEYFREKFAKNQYKTIRKNNGCLILATQSPSDAINNSIARTIIEQTPVNIYLPNESASKDDYINGFKLTLAEWETFEQLTKESRRFLVKKGTSDNSDSLIAMLPLHGMDDELNVLSGRKANNNIFEKLFNEDGKLPSDWIAQYQEQVKQANH